mmetsp:Transcript_38903/g.65254  ORF Transcript_38903/g.65254 Transcript_38903/m.65254 type:complete len:183 (+) Transcript_38903:40-588(+)
MAARLEGSIGPRELTHRMTNSGLCERKNAMNTSKRRKNRSMFSFRSFLRCEPTFSSRVPIKKTVTRHRSTQSLGWLGKSARIQKKQCCNAKSLNTGLDGRRKKKGLNLVTAAELRSLNVKLRERAIGLAKMAIYYKKMFVFAYFSTAVGDSCMHIGMKAHFNSETVPSDREMLLYQGPNRSR